MNRNVLRSLGVTAVAVLGVALGTAVAPADAASPGHARRVTSGSFADPGFAHFGKYYYVYATGAGFPVLRASSPAGHYVRTTKSGHSMPHIPGWVGQDKDGARHLWAPDVHAVTQHGRTTYVMYFTGFRKGWGNSCVGVATSHAPDRDFHATGQPICAAHSDHAAIDPSAYRDRTGRRWIVFKTNVGNKRDFRIQAIQMDSTRGVTPSPKTRRTLLYSAKDKMEAPSLVTHGGKVWLFLARHDYANCSYTTDAHYASSITGTFHLSRTVMSRKSTGLCGPGGATVIQDGSTTRIAFHAYAGGSPKSKSRPTWVGTLRWTSKGAPYLY